MGDMHTTALSPTPLGSPLRAQFPATLIGYPAAVIVPSLCVNVPLMSTAPSNVKLPPGLFTLT